MYVSTGIQCESGVNGEYIYGCHTACHDYGRPARTGVFSRHIATTRRREVERAAKARYGTV